VVRSSCLNGSRLFDSQAGVDFHRRALRKECRRRLPREYPREICSIEFGAIAIKAGSGAWPDSPWFVRHVVFECASAALSGITPVVLGNKFFRAAARRLNGKAYTLRVDSIPFSIQTPCIFGCDVRLVRFDAIWKMRRVEPTIPLCVLSGSIACACPAALTYWPFAPPAQPESPDRSVRLESCECARSPESFRHADR
jgi:hypothetical protein